MPGKSTSSVYKLTAFPDPVMESDYEITVYGKKSTHERINVLEAELQYGLTDNVNKILFVKIAVSQIPERGSSIIIRGGGIYDDTYIISDVPMFPPSHFTNYPTLDISGTMISTMENLGSDLLLGTITNYRNFFIDPGLWFLIQYGILMNI